MESIEGSVEDIVYRNEENGYTVLIVDAGGEEPLTCVGSFPMLAEGETIKAEGVTKDSPKYGKQFVVSKLELVKPDTVEGIARFLASGLIKNVGQATALNIVSKFGLQSLDVIEGNHTQLSQIKGITPRKAEEIYESYKEARLMRNAVMFLQGYDITPLMCIKIYHIYQEKTEIVLRKNPYILIQDVDGIGFVTADKIAKKMGIEPDSVFRMRACLAHLLKEAADKNGHTFLPLGELCDAANRLLSTVKTTEEFLDILKSMSIEGSIKLLAKDEPTIVMSARIYQAERGVAAKLIRLNDNGDGVAAEDCVRRIAQYETQHGIEFHAAQKEAIVSCIACGVAVITGGPGTGKTTIIKCVLDIMTTNGHTTALLAPTGRAAKRMSEATGKPAMTIHRALQSEFGGGGGKFLKNEQNPLDATFVIVDEVSMVDIFLMHNLLKALRPGTRLLLVGDKDQLPSVGAGSVLGDILESDIITVSCLTQIYRQAEASHIVTNAHLINGGHMPEMGDKSAASDFFFLQRDSQAAIAATALEMVRTRLPKYLDIDSGRVQLLSPMKNGVAGVLSLNKMCQDALNPKTSDRDELAFGEDVLRTGDKVMQTVNNYDLDWVKTDALGAVEGSGVFNGDVGSIVTVRKDSCEIEVLYEDGRLTAYNRETIDQLTLAYAITVHKSQGCEFDAVVMPIVSGNPYLLTRNLLYTGITRAKRMVVLIGDLYNLGRMVSNNFTQRRNSMLGVFLRELNEKSGLIV